MAIDNISIKWADEMDAVMIGERAESGTDGARWLSPWQLTDERAEQQIQTKFLKVSYFYSLFHILITMCGAFIYSLTVDKLSTITC